MWRQAQLALEMFGLRAFSRAGSAEEDEVHLLPVGLEGCSEVRPRHRLAVDRDDLRDVQPELPDRSVEAGVIARRRRRPRPIGVEQIGFEQELLLRQVRDQHALDVLRAG